MEKKTPQGKFVEVSVRQKSYPEATLWAVIPRQDWINKGWMMRDFLELVESKACGQTFQEAIFEQERLMNLPTEELMKEDDELTKEMNEIGPLTAEQVDKQPLQPEFLRMEEIFKRKKEIHNTLKLRLNARSAKESLEWQLQRLVDRLEELDLQKDLDFSTSPIEYEVQMTPDELDIEEQKLLYPDKDW